jgi:hypothetical protein
VTFEEESRVALRSIKVLSAIAIGIALACCSQVVEVVDTDPGVSDAQSFIDEAVTRNSAGRLKPISIAKTGGRRLKTTEGDGYELWYAVTAELTQDALWSPSAYKRFSTLPAGSPEGFLFHPAKTGEQVTIPGTLVFRKDKNGWAMEKDERY